MLGPATLFDKSFLQSLSLDESVWFDHFFSPTIAPFFYAETLADLEKRPPPGMTPEQAVAIIADKFPEMSGTPCIFHNTLVEGNLLGQRIPMDGRIPRPAGRLVHSEGQIARIYDQTPEEEAFARWKQREFKQLERSNARVWRTALETLDLAAIAVEFRKIGIDGRTCKSLEEAKALALTRTSDLAIGSDPLSLSLLFLGADKPLRDEVFRRHRAHGNPRLSAFAPYASFVLEIEVFFQVAIGAGLISSERPSNRTDIAYLFYLPFCMLFVSSDKLHDRCARFFLRPDQQFLWGLDLKDGLKELDRHYKTSLPQAEKDRGVIAFAPWPPVDDRFLVSRIFDQFQPGWRARTAPRPKMDPEAEKRLVEELNKLTKAHGLPAEPLESDESVDIVSVQRRVRRKKGSWNLVPEDLPDPPEE